MSEYYAEVSIVLENRVQCENHYVKADTHREAAEKIRTVIVQHYKGNKSIILKKKDISCFPHRIIWDEPIKE